MHWLSTYDCAEKEWYFSFNQNIGCSFWPGETSAGKRALKSRDIWKSPGCFPGARFALGRLHRFRVCSKFNFITGESSAAVADGLLSARMKLNTAAIDDIFFKIRLPVPWLPLKPGKYCSASSTTLQGLSLKSDSEFEIGSSGTFVPNFSNSKAMQATECKASARNTSRALSNITVF